MRNHNALYAMVSMEQPKYAKYLSNLAYLQSSFDLMMTYSLNSTYPGTTLPNLPITYFPLNIVSTSAVMQPERPFAEKTGYDTGIEHIICCWGVLFDFRYAGVPVVLFTSNCDRAGATERYKYLEELMRHVKVIP